MGYHNVFMGGDILNTGLNYINMITKQTGFITFRSSE